MRNWLMKSVLALVYLTLVSVPAPTRAQTANIGLSLYTSPTTVSRGQSFGVFALVTNNTGGKLRTTVTITALAPCGTETQLGYAKLALNPGQGMQVTVGSMIPPDGCTGVYTITVSASSGGKNSAVSSTSTYLTVN